MKRTLLIVTITLLFACCEKEDDDNMNMTTPGYISSDCEGF